MHEIQMKLNVFWIMLNASLAFCLNSVAEMLTLRCLTLSTKIYL